MKRYLAMLIFCVCLFFSSVVYAQEILHKEWEEEFEVPEISEEIEALIGSLEYNSVKQKEQEKIELYRLLNKDMALSSYKNGALAKIYDPRSLGAVTPVRNQRYNTCWAFSTLAAGEQSLLLKGYSDVDFLDLSEAHLSYFFYHPVLDPLGNTKGDGNFNISLANFLNVGSNTIFSTFALANWVGAANEAAAPFENLNEKTVYNESLAYANEAHLQNAYWINFKDVDAVNIIKQMILKYGAAAINLYFDYSYFEGSRAAYYFPLDSSQANNHSVTIVGWDDTFSRENFKEEFRPSGDGAWIVKNSYGEEWGEEGYFYLSYEDSAVNSGNTSKNRARAYVFDFEPADNYDYNYQYDGSAGAYNATNSTSTLTKIDSKESIANVFSVKKKENVRCEQLQAVSFALFDTAVSYSIQIYKNLTDIYNPTSGIKQLSVPVTGSTSYAGYYTIPLPVSVPLEEGDTFSVVITLEKESGGQVEFFIDKSYQNGSWVAFTNEVEAGQSFRSQKGIWEDMAGHGATIRMKAFTVAEAEPAAEWISLNDLQKDADGYYTVTLWLDDTYTLKPSVFPVSAKQTLKWDTSDASVVTVDASGSLHPVSAGTAVITGKAEDGSGVFVSCKVTVRQKAGQIALSVSSLELEKGEKAAIGVEFLPKGSEQQEILWKSSGKAVSVDSSGVVEALRKGKAKVTAVLKSDESIFAVCTVNVTENRKELKQEKPTAALNQEEREAIEPNGVSHVTAAKSAKTLDVSGIRMGFWFLILLFGFWLLKKGRGQN